MVKNFSRAKQNCGFVALYVSVHRFSNVEMTFP